MEEAHYRLLRLLDASPNLTQRELAREMGVSLGKVNSSSIRDPRTTTPS